VGIASHRCGPDPDVYFPRRPELRPGAELFLNFKDAIKLRNEHEENGQPSILILYQDVKPLPPRKPRPTVDPRELPQGVYNYVSYLDYHVGPPTWEWTAHGWRDPKTAAVVKHRPKPPKNLSRGKPFLTNVYIVVPSRDPNVDVEPDPLPTFWEVFAKTTAGYPFE
jgi:hypothetical protein